MLNLSNLSFAPPHAGGDRLGEGVHCCLFMLSASLPMILISVFSLYHTRSLAPVKSLALAGVRHYLYVIAAAVAVSRYATSSA
ncbi:hypothetical protein [Candidatus Pantoea persica]|uniref:hypothetical protein n=1 Tax=Candidatus Pantoea persica TaxID=2518128 RepID=UPI0035A95A03|nr:membrane protein, DUF1109 domain-containing protein [Candidatus Pantoea persica]